MNTITTIIKMFEKAEFLLLPSGRRHKLVLKQTVTSVANEIFKSTQTITACNSIASSEQLDLSSLKI